MASIILPSHLRRQPGQLLQPVDGIESVLNYGVPGYGLVQGRPVARGTLTAGWTALTAKGVGSLAGYTSGSSKYLGGLTVPSLPTARFYLAWYVNLVRGAGASQAQTLFSASGPFGSSTVCQIVPASTGIVLTFVHTHDYTTRLSLSHTFTGDPGWGLLEAKGDGTTVGLYFNGTLLTSGAPSAWYNHTNTPELCLRAIDWAYTVSVVLAVASRRHLPNTKQYVDNPWSVFRPRRRVLYFETAGGGTIYNESLIESGTLVETYLGNVIYPTSFTETAGLADSNQASNITSAVFTETESLQDSVAAIQTLGAILNESATLTDSNTVLTTFNPTLTEQATLQDNNTVITTFNATITDSLTGVDTYTGLVVFSATITETLTDPDSYAAEVSVVINESISGTDSYAVTVNYVTTLNETASVADTISTSWVCNVTLTEIQALVDSITAYISGEEPTSFDIVNLKSFITRILPTNSKITTSITKNSKL